MHRAHRTRVLKHLEKTRMIIKEKFKEYNGPNEGLSLCLLLGDAPHWFESNAV